MGRKSTDLERQEGEHAKELDDIGIRGLEEVLVELVGRQLVSAQPDGTPCSQERKGGVWQCWSRSSCRPRARRQRNTP